MQIAQIEIPYHSRRAVIPIYFIGDVHLGSAHCDEEKLNRTIAEVKNDPTARVVLMGDLCEYIPRGEWRWRQENIAEWVDQTNVGESERDEIVKLLRPIKAKILGAIQGNHELELADTWNQNVHKETCEELQIRNFGYSALVRLSFAWKRGKAQTGDTHGITLYLHHGWGGGRSDGADVNRFNDLMRGYDADWYIAGHTHRRYAIKSIQHRLNGQNKLSERVRLCGRSGTFLKSISAGRFNYSEKTAMPPLQTGALKILYHPEKEDAVAEI